LKLQGKGESVGQFGSWLFFSRELVALGVVLNVLREVALLDKLALADRTDKASLVVMSAVLVRDQIALLSVGLGTLGAGEWANPRVYAAVGDQIALGKQLPTVRARKFPVVG
jgi:hypothetical protein